MENISRTLLDQRLRNRVIELLELCASFEDIATLGAFEVINMIDDWLPLESDKALNVFETSKVFSENEKQATAQFFKLMENAAEVTDQDCWDVAWFESSSEWVELSKFSKETLEIFAKRGRFSEEIEGAKII